jgi:hypothetical protein
LFRDVENRADTLRGGFRRMRQMLQDLRLFKFLILDSIFFVDVQEGRYLLVMVDFGVTIGVF